jgi:hypothetical protein
LFFDATIQQKQRCDKSQTRAESSNIEANGQAESHHGEHDNRHPDKP